MILRIKKSFPIRNLMLWTAMVCVFSYALLEHVSIPIPMFSAVKRPLLYIGGLCILTQMNVLLRNILKRRYFFVMMTLLLLCIALVLSMVLSRNGIKGVSPQNGTFRLMLYLLELFLLMILLAEAGWGRHVFRFLYGYLLVLVLLTDIFMLTGMVRFVDGQHENYLVGTKFTVSYMHMNLTAFGLIKRMNKKQVEKLPWWLIFGAAAMLIWISVRVNCMTGVIGVIMLAVLYMWQSKANPEKVKILTSQELFLACLLISFIFPFVVEGITKLPFVEYVISDVLERSTNLTGRLNIYQNFVDKMQGHWLLGFGFGTANAVSVKLFGYANTQNALLNWILQCGLLGTTLLVMLMTVVIRQIDRCKAERMTQIRPLLALIYVYIAIGTVEPTVDMSFILWLVILFMYVNSSESVTSEKRLQK